MVQPLKRNPAIVEKRKQRIKSAIQHKRRRKGGKMGMWYYQKYKVPSGMNPYSGSKLRNKLIFDHRTNTMPRTVVKNKVMNSVLDAEK